jgi:RsiW-degrading membrane proteinase PrsW (M82 family)
VRTEPALLEELRFAKKQQWYVATSAVTLNAAVFALLRGSQLRDFEALAAVFIVLFVTAAGVGVLWQLQDHLRNVRRDLKEHDPPWHRPTDVVILLTFVVVAVAFVVLYCLSHPQFPQSATSSHA